MVKEILPYPKTFDRRIENERLFVLSLVVACYAEQRQRTLKVRRSQGETDPDPAVRINPEQSPQIKIQSG